MASKVVDFAAEVERLGIWQPFPEPWWQGRPYQLLARHFLMTKKRRILSVDKGMGKTSTVLSVFEDPAVHKNIPGFTVIIFTTEKGMSAYVRDLKKFPEHEDKIQLVYGHKDVRHKQWRNPKAKYFIVTYNSFLSDTGSRNSKHQSGREIIVPGWVMNNNVDGVVCDEFHRVFRRRKSATFDLFKRLFKHTEYFFPISGSAVDKSPADLWPALHLCDQKEWSSYHRYVNTWCEMETSWAGYTQIAGPKMDLVPKWQALMKHWAFHVTADMTTDMPPKQRDDLPSKMNESQQAMYNKAVSQTFLEIQDEEGNPDFVFFQNHLAKNHKLRLALICPKAIDPSQDVGQGIVDIWDDAEEGGAKQYAIFTPFKAPIPFLVEYLIGRGAKVWVLQGGIGYDEQERRLDEWRRSLVHATPDHPSIVLSTIKYAESWEIPEARYGYFLGEEVVREDNIQAEDRLRRLISVGMTYIRYVRFKGTAQDDTLELLLRKGKNWRAMFEDWENLKARLLVTAD